MGKLNQHLAEVPVATKSVVYSPPKVTPETKAPEVELETPMLSATPEPVARPQPEEAIQSVNHAVLEERIYTGVKY